jgi:hypothetical protein
MHHLRRKDGAHFRVVTLSFEGIGGDALTEFPPQHRFRLAFERGRKAENRGATDWAVPTNGRLVWRHNVALNCTMFERKGAMLKKEMKIRLEGASSGLIAFKPKVTTIAKGSLDLAACFQRRMPRAQILLPCRGGSLVLEVAIAFREWRDGDAPAEPETDTGLSDADDSLASDSEVDDRSVSVMSTAGSLRSALDERTPDPAPPWSPAPVAETERAAPSTRIRLPPPSQARHPRQSGKWPVVIDSSRIPNRSSSGVPVTPAPTIYTASPCSAFQDVRTCALAPASASDTSSFCSTPKHSPPSATPQTERFKHFTPTHTKGDRPPSPNRPLATRSRASTTPAPTEPPRTPRRDNHSEAPAPRDELPVAGFLPAEGWRCGACQYFNRSPLTACCSLCLAPRHCDYSERDGTASACSSARSSRSGARQPCKPTNRVPSKASGGRRCSACSAKSDREAASTPQRDVPPPRRHSERPLAPPRPSSPCSTQNSWETASQGHRMRLAEEWVRQSQRQYAPQRRGSFGQESAVWSEAQRARCVSPPALSDDSGSPDEHDVAAPVVQLTAFESDEEAPAGRARQGRRRGDLVGAAKRLVPHYPSQGRGGRPELCSIPHSISSRSSDCTAGTYRPLSVAVRSQGASTDLWDR